MNLDYELTNIESKPLTEAELIEQQTALNDMMSDLDEYFGEDALTSDVTHAYESFMTNNETDYWGYDPDELYYNEFDEQASNEWWSGGYHVVDNVYEL